MLRRIGSSAYSTSATITVRLPMPPMNGIGIRKPNSARLGMVCMMLENPSSQGRGSMSRQEDSQRHADGDRQHHGVQHQQQVLRRKLEDIAPQVRAHYV